MRAVAFDDLTGALLQRAQLVGFNRGDTHAPTSFGAAPDLRGAGLRTANLAGFDLRGADLRRADLTRANLRGARPVGRAPGGGRDRRAPT